MGIVLGIDIGSSATKIVAMDESKTILSSLKVSASDPVTAMYGAVGKILCEERMQIADVEAVMLTGMYKSKFRLTTKPKGDNFLTKPLPSVLLFARFHQR